MQKKSKGLAEWAARAGPTLTAGQAGGRGRGLRGHTVTEPGFTEVTEGVCGV